MNDNLRSAQQQLLQEIDGSISDKSILKVLSKVPRQMFVPRKYYYSAYENVQKYDWKHVGKLYLNLYNDLLKS